MIFSYHFLPISMLEEPKNRTLSPWKLENSILKKDKKKRTLSTGNLEFDFKKTNIISNIIFWERHKSLFLFFVEWWHAGMNFFQLNHEQQIRFSNLITNKIPKNQCKRVWHTFLLLLFFTVLELFYYSLLFYSR